MFFGSGGDRPREAIRLSALGQGFLWLWASVSQSRCLWLETLKFEAFKTPPSKLSHSKQRSNSPQSWPGKCQDRALVVGDRLSESLWEQASHQGRRATHYFCYKESPAQPPPANNVFPFSTLVPCALHTRNPLYLETLMDAVRSPSDPLPHAARASESAPPFRWQMRGLPARTPARAGRFGIRIGRSSRLVRCSCRQRPWPSCTI